MSDIEALLEHLQLDNQLKIEDIPDLELYMDQVIQLFERTFSSSKRNDEEKILTKTMINNYAKGKLFFPIKNKKYTKEHILLISMIYQLKGTLSISDIKTTLTELNERIVDEQVDIEPIYERYLSLYRHNGERFAGDVIAHVEEVKSEVNQLEEADDDMEQLLLIASFVQMSNFYRRIAERMVDELSKNRKEED